MHCVEWCGLMSGREASGEEIKRISKSNLIAISMLTFSLVLVMVMVVLMIHGLPEHWIPLLVLSIFLMIFGFSLYGEE